MSIRQRFIQSVYGASALVAGYVVCTLAMGWTAAAFVISGAPERLHSRLIIVGAGLILVGYARDSRSRSHGLRLGWVVMSGFVTGARIWNVLVISDAKDCERSTRVKIAPWGRARYRQRNLMGGALGAAAAGALANMLGLSRNFVAGQAEKSAPILFAAFLPFVMGLGVVAAVKVARPTAPSVASS